MQRRSSAISGCVNFPVGDASWKNSFEGGMVVKLVVCDNRDMDDEFAMCSGAYVVDQMNESFISDDKRPRPEHGVYESLEDIEKAARIDNEWQAYHFPNAHEDGQGALQNKYASRPYLAALVLASTGWSGYSESEGYWEC